MKITKTQMAAAMAPTQASVVFGDRGVEQEFRYLARNYNWQDLRDALVRRADRITAGTFRTPVNETDANRVVELALELI